MASAKQLKVTLSRSMNGRLASHKACVRGLGLQAARLLGRCGVMPGRAGVIGLQKRLIPGHGLAGNGSKSFRRPFRAADGFQIGQGLAPIGRDIDRTALDDLVQLTTI